MTADVPGSEPTLSRQMLELEKGLSLRIETLENDNRRLRRLMTSGIIGVAVLLGLTAALVVVTARHGLPGTVADVIESHQFVVRDHDGQVRGAFGLADDGSLRLGLQDGAGKAALRLSLLKSGAPGITFTDSMGRPRVVMGLLPDQSTNLVFADASGRSRMVLGLAPDGSTTLAFADAMGATRAGLGVDASGRGSFSIFDASSQRSSAAADADDTATSDDSTASDSSKSASTINRQPGKPRR